MSSIVKGEILNDKMTRTWRETCNLFFLTHIYMVVEREEGYENVTLKNAESTSETVKDWI